MPTEWIAVCFAKAGLLLFPGSVFMWRKTTFGAQSFGTSAEALQGLAERESAPWVFSFSHPFPEAAESSVFSLPSLQFFALPWLG